jgi:hypothetical protein
MDGRKNNGGARAGAGKKPKEDVIKVAEKFRSIMSDEVAIKKLAEKVKDGDIKAIELWLAYTNGKPQQNIDHTTNGKEINITPIQWASEQK